jgi:hypothetical protein
MADAHVSDGVAVGSVFATEATVVPEDQNDLVRRRVRLEPIAVLKG